MPPPIIRPRTADNDDSASPSPVVNTLTDLAKHLRQVQFYYMLVCLGLLLVVFLPRDSSLERASDQLEEIFRFRSESGDEPIWSVAGAAEPKSPSRETATAVLLFQLAEPDGSDGKPHACFLHDKEIIRGDWGLAGVSGVTDFRQVSTLREFSDLWFSLQSEDSFLRVEGFSQQAYFERFGSEGLDLSKPIAVQMITNPAQVRQIYDLAFTLGPEQAYKPTNAEWVSLDDTISGAKHTHGIQLRRSFAFADKGALILPATVTPARAPVLNQLLAKSKTPFQYLKADDYLMVHPDLSDFTLQGDLDELDLYALRSMLKKMRVLQGEKFPVFGVNVPFQLIFEYGLSVLLVMQLFFYGHLRSFRLMTDDQPRKVWAPWLPLYSNRVSRLMTIASVTLFPIVVIAQLVMAAEYPAASVMIGCCGAGVSVLLLFEFLKIWYAPDKVATPADETLEDARQDSSDSPRRQAA